MLMVSNWWVAIGRSQWKGYAKDVFVRNILTTSFVFQVHKAKIGGWISNKLGTNVSFTCNRRSLAWLTGSAQRWRANLTRQRKHRSGYNNKLAASSCASRAHGNLNKHECWGPIKTAAWYAHIFSPGEPRRISAWTCAYFTVAINLMRKSRWEEAKDAGA